MTTLGFPPDSTPEEEKLKPDFHLSYANEIEGRYVSSRYNYLENRARFLELRRQAEGLIDYDEFKQDLSYGGDTSLLNLRWDAQSPLPKIVNTLVGKFSSQGYNPTFKPLDPRSTNELDKERAKVYNAVKIRKVAEEYQKKTGQPLVANIDELPADKEQAELWATMNVKASASIAAEKIWQYVRNNVDFAEIEEMIWRDLVVLKRAVIRVDFDQNGNIVPSYVDPVDFGTSYVNKQTASDAKYMFHVEKMSIDQLYQEANGQISYEEIMSIAKDAAGTLGNPPWQNNTDWNQTYYPYQNLWRVPWASFLVNVMKIEYKSTNVKKAKKEVLNDKTGKYRFDIVSQEYEIPKYGKKDRTTFTASEEVIYTCSKVMGRDIVYNYGRKKNQPVDVVNGLPAQNTDFSYCVIMPHIYDMQNKSLLEACIPPANQMILCQLKMQLLIAKAKPPGVAVDVSALTNAIMGEGGEYWTPLDHQAVYEQIGTYYYASMGEDGALQNQQPIRELVNGISPEIVRIIDVYNFSLKNIYDITGHSDGMDGTMPSKDALVGIQQMIARNSNNALKYIEQSFEKVYAKAVKRTILCSQMSIRAGRKKPFEMALGEDVVKAIDLMKDYSLVSLGVELELLPNEQQIQLIESLLATEVKNQTLRLEDVFAIMYQVRKSPALAERMLINARKRYAAEKAEADQRNIMLTAQVQKESAAYTHQMKLQEIAAEQQKELAKINTEYDRKEQYLKLFESPSKVEQIIVEGEVKKELIEAAKDDEQPSVAPRLSSKPDSLKNSSIEAGGVVKEPPVFPSKPSPI